MDALLLGLDKALYILDRCKVYECIYTMLVACNAPVTNAKENFEQSLVELYRVILQFLSNAIRFYRGKLPARTFSAFWNPNRITDFDGSCSDLASRVETEIQNWERLCNQTLFTESSSRLETLIRQLRELGDLKNSLDQMKNEISDMHCSVDKSWNRSKEIKRDEILKWVSEIPYLDHHRMAVDDCTADTGNWLFDHPNFRGWRSDSKSSYLWLNGIRESTFSFDRICVVNALLTGLAGAGKTKLVSRVIGGLKEQYPSDPMSGLAFFYCYKNESDRRDPMSILCSLVKQLGISADRNAIHGSLVKIYEEKRKDGFASNELCIADCKALLSEMINAYNETMIIIDALDESYEENRLILVDVLEQLVETLDRGKVKILISSRQYGDIEYRLREWVNMRIEQKHIENDIAKWVNERINQGQSRRRNPISSDLRNKIIETLLEQNDGM